MSGRATIILERFPRHIEAAGRGKRFGTVVGALARDLDTQTGQVGDIRRAHRLGDAPTTTDLVRLAGVHGLGGAALEPVRQRLGPHAPMAARLDAERTVIRGLIDAHRTGNGTPAGLARAAAAYLGLAVDGPVAHTDDRWWHLARCADLVPAPPGAAPSDEEPEPDLLAVEENPSQPADVAPAPRRHGERFAVVRGGLEAVPVTVVVTGIEDRTVQPMVVNLDTGSGLAFEGAVPEGGALRFHADGRVDLDGTLVLGRAYSFRGAVFADEDAPVPGREFLFAGDDATGEAPPRSVDGVLADRTAHWAVTEPVGDAFSSDGAFPHAEGLVDPAWLARGRTRWAVFAGRGTYALRWANGRIRNAAPRFQAGFFDRTVFAPDPAGAPSLAVGFEWQEREPFAVRVWIPARFAELDSDSDEPPVRERLRSLLDRHRAAGVRLSVAYADPRWTLGTGILRDLDSSDPLGLVVTGTAMWPEDTDQPAPD